MPFVSFFFLFFLSFPFLSISLSLAGLTPQKLTWCVRILQVYKNIELSLIDTERSFLYIYICEP